MSDKTITCDESNSYVCIDENTYYLTKNNNIISLLENEKIDDHPEVLFNAEELSSHLKDQFEKRMSDDLNFTEKRSSVKDLHVTLGVTEECNLRCKYCIYSGIYMEERTHSNKKMTNNTIDNVIDTIKSNYSELESIDIYFYGGEPVLNFNVLKYAITQFKKIFKNQKLFFMIATNGLVLKDKHIKFLKDNNFYVQISLDGSKKVHDRYRVDLNNKGSFDRVMSNVDKLKKSDIKVGFSCTVAPPEMITERANFFNQYTISNGYKFNISSIEKNSLLKYYLEAVDPIIERNDYLEYENMLNRAS